MKQSFVTVPYSAPSEVHAITVEMGRKDYELVLDHKEAKLLDFALRTAVQAGGKPSFRMKLALTMVFFTITLAALEFMGGFVSRWLGH